MLSACSLNGIGAADATVTKVAGGVVVTSRAYGVILDTSRDAAGVSIGYLYAVQLFAGDAAAPAAGHHGFGVASPDLPVLARYRRVAGLELGVGSSMFGLALGLSERMNTAPIAADASVWRKLTILPDQPAQARIELCEGSVQC